MTCLQFYKNIRKQVKFSLTLSDECCMIQPIADLSKVEATALLITLNDEALYSQEIREVFGSRREFIARQSFRT